MNPGKTHTYTVDSVGYLDVMSLDCSKMTPGSIVVCKGLEKSTEGIVVGTDETNSWVTVLWNRWPHPDDIFTIPNIRNVRFSPISIAKQIVHVQPMTSPSQSIFYIDYRYGSDSHGEDDE